MDYQAIYGRLIERGRNRVLDGYRERHHIVPKCLGGGNDKSNLVDLTPEEHFIAHLLLAKLNPRHWGLLSAVYVMAKERRPFRRSRNKAYGWVRRRMSEVKRPPEIGQKISLARLGMKFTPEHRKNISLGRSGWKRPQEATERIAAKLRGVKKDPAFGAKISASKKGKPATTPPWNVGRAGTYGTSRKGTKGVPHTAEHKAKISAAHLARRGLPKKPRATPTPEAIAKRAAGIKAAHAKRLEMGLPWVTRPRTKEAKPRKPISQGHKDRIREAALERYAANPRTPEVVAKMVATKAAKKAARLGKSSLFEGAQA